MKITMLKRMMSLLLCLCMVLSYVPATVFAAEADGLCGHHETHTDECGYAPAVEGSDCTHECGDDCAEGCIHIEHDEGCGYQEAVAEQPCAFAEGCDTCAEEEAAAKASAEAVESVRALIEALPSLEELEAMSWEDKQDAYADTQAADEAYQALTDAQKAELTEENAKLDELFGYFNTLTEPTETYAGSCGSFSTWSFDSETGTLTISGQGQIRDYEEEPGTPWYREGLDLLITTVVIEEGITKVGKYAFDGVEKLETVYLPKSLTTIDTGAFRINSSGDPVIKDVYYAGTEALWDTISISETYDENVCLQNATAFHYAYLCTEGHEWTIGASSRVCSVCGETAPFEGYKLWVNGVGVNEGNTADVLGDGTVSYDADSNTLSLNNANITKAFENGDDHLCAILYTGTDALTISATGSNTVNTINNGADSSGTAGSCGIYSTGDVILTGTGYLYVQGGTAIRTTGDLYIGEDFDQSEQSLSLHLRANSRTSEFAVANTIHFPRYSHEYDKDDGWETDYYSWRDDLTEEFSTNDPDDVTYLNPFEIKGGSGHAISYIDNGDTTHKVQCACGEVLIENQPHSNYTACSCGIALATVNTEDDPYADSYRDLHKAIEAAANDSAAQYVMLLYSGSSAVTSMTMTEDATLSAEDILRIGTDNSSGKTLVIDGATLTLAEGSEVFKNLNTISCINGGRVVDLGATVYGQHFTPHTHTNWKYTDNGDGTHSKTYDCSTCGITYYDGSDPVAHGGWVDGLCGDCGAECEHDYSEGICSNCGNICLHPDKDADGVCPDCGFAPVVKVTVGEEYWLFGTLTEALAAIPKDGTKVTLTLLSDVTEKITIEDNMDVVFEGGEHSLTVSSGNAITVKAGKLEVVSGTVKATAYNGYGIFNATTGTVTLKGTAKVEVTGASAYGLYNNGGGTLNVEGGSVTSGYYGLENYSGTVNISGGSVTGNVYGINNNGTLNITGGSVTGTTSHGIYNKGGIQITGGSVTGAGDGINVQESNSKVIKITGGTITGGRGYYALNNPNACNMISLAGGVYLGGLSTKNTNFTLSFLLASGCEYYYYENGAVASAYAGNTWIVTGDLTVVCSHKTWTDGVCAACGEVCQHDTYTEGVCAVCGAACQHSYDNGVCTGCGAVAVVKAVVGSVTTYYTDLDELNTYMTGLTGTDTVYVTLLDNASGEGDSSARFIFPAKKIVLDLNGKTATLPTVWYAEGADVTIQNSSTTEGFFKITVQHYVGSGAKLTLNSGCIQNTKSYSAGVDAYGTFIMNGGVVIGDLYDVKAGENAKVTITGGELAGTGNHSLYNIGECENIQISGGVFNRGIFASDAGEADTKGLTLADLMADGYTLVYSEKDGTVDMEATESGASLKAVCKHEEFDDNLKCICCRETAKVQVTVGETASYYVTPDEAVLAMEQMTTTNTVYMTLLGDAAAEGRSLPAANTFRFPGKTVVLELNGYTLSAVNVTEAADADLTIQDSSNAGTGKLLVAKTTTVSNAAAVTLKSGTIETVGDSANTLLDGVGVSGTFRMEGGKVSGLKYGITTKATPANITVTGGTVTGGTYAIRNYTQAQSISLAGGTFENGIYASKDSTLVSALLAEGCSYVDASGDAVAEADVQAYTYGSTLSVVCGHAGDSVAATCKAPAYCGICGQYYGEKADHTIDNATGYCVHDCDTYMAKVTVTVGETTTYYTTATEAFASEAISNMTSGQTATVKLLDSITQEASIQAPAKNIVLDLNGETLSVWSVSANGTGVNLTVKDSTASAAGVLQTKYIVAVSSGAVLTLESGKVDAQVAHSSFTGGINVASGTLNITGGTVAAADHGIYVTDSNAVVNISGGIIRDSGAEDKYALYNREDSSENITLSGGVFMGGIYASAGSGETPAVISDMLADGYKYTYSTGGSAGTDFPNAGNCCYTEEGLAVVCNHTQTHADSKAATCQDPAYCGNCGQSYGQPDEDAHGPVDPATGECTYGCGTFTAKAAVMANEVSSYYASLTAAMAAVPTDGATKATVTLLADSTECITVTAGMDLVLDGGEFSIAPSGGHPVTITGGKLEVVSGTISTTSLNGYPINISGGEIILSGTTKVTAAGTFANLIYGANSKVTVTGQAELSGVRGIIMSSGTVTVSGGSITATGISTSGIAASGNSTVTVSGGEVSGTYYGITNAAGTVTVSGGEVAGGVEGIFSGGTVTINGGTVTGETNGISTDMDAGLTTVNNGTVEGGTHGIYCVGTSSAKITGGTVTGGSYAVRNNGSGNITVTGGAVTSTEGGGIYNIGYGAIIVSGGTIIGTGTGNSKFALYNHSEAPVSLSGGIFVGGIYAANGNSEQDATVAKLLETGYQYQYYYPDTETVGGVYAASVYETKENLIVTCDHTRDHADNVPATCQAPAYCGSCKQSYGSVASHAINNATGKCIYGCGNDLTKVTVAVGTTTTYYTEATTAFASEAISNMTSGQTATVKLLDSIYENAPLSTPANNVVLDLNGKTLRVWNVSVGGTGASLTVKDSSTGAAGVLQTRDNVMVRDGGALTLESGKVDAQMTYTVNGGINVNKGTLNITGGTLVSGEHGIFAVNSDSLVNISGGVIQDSGADDKYALYNLTASSENISLSGGIFLGGIFTDLENDATTTIQDFLTDGYKYANYDTASGIGDDFGVDCSATGRNLAVVCNHKNLSHTADEATNTITATCANTTCYKHGEVLGTLVLTAADYTYNSEVYEAYEATVTGTGIYAGTTLTADYAKGSDALTGAPAKAGSYTASLTVGGKTVSDDFVVRQATLTPSISGTAVKTYDGTKQVTEGQLSINLTRVYGQDSVQATATFLYGQTDVGTEITVTAGDIRLNGTDADNYKLSTNLVTAKVGTINPKPVTDVTFPSTSSIVYGITLGDIRLIGGDGNGTFAWADETLKPEVGNEGYAMLFTPGDTKNYDYSNVEGWNPVTKTVIRNVPIQVSKANPAIGTVSAADVKNSTDITKVKLTRSDTAVAGTLTLNAGQTLKLGANTLAYTFTPSSGNYKAVSGTVTVNVVDTVAPTGTVTMAENTWNKFLSKITFGLFFNKTQTVTATAADSFSGVASIEYYSTGKVLDLAGVKALADSKWTQMNSGKVNVTAEDAKQFIYYIRITDKAGNVAYLATNGAEFDTTAPVITGVEDGETYTETREVTVTDKNLKTVTLNGETVTGTITLTCDPDVAQEYTIAATDKAGNTTTVKVTMAVVCDGGHTCPSAPYRDVDTSLWYHEAIDYVIENGIMQGHPGKVFGPDETLTRAQMVQILYNLEGRPAVSGQDSYTDTNPTEWYADPVLWATQKGIVEGYGGGKFGPSDPLTREQMVTILYRYSQYKGYDLTTGSYSSFPDAGDVSGYAKTPMAWAIGKGIIIGMNDGTLCPGCKSTRAQVATVLMRYVEMFK